VRARRKSSVRVVGVSISMLQPAIRAALQAVAHGYCILPAALARRSPRGRELGLTPREQSVLELLVAGHRNAEIARALHITERTVESHVTHVLAKLGVHSRVQAVRCAQEHGLVDTSRPGPQPR